MRSKVRLQFPGRAGYATFLAAPKNNVTGELAGHLDHCRRPGLRR